MSAIPQQLLASQKASLDHMLSLQNAFFSGFERMVDLNLKVIRTTLDDLAEKSQQAVELKDAQEALTFTSGLVQPNAEKALAYSKHVYDILSNVQSELSSLAENQYGRTQEQVQEAIEQFARNAPTGSEGAVALLKSTVATANSAYESVAKVVRQTTDAAESNMKAAASATFKAASDATEAAAKAAPRASVRRAPAAGAAAE